MELVVDFELATGIDMGHPKHGRQTPWYVKAEMPKKLFMHLCKCYKYFEAPPMRKTTSSIQIFTDGRHRGLSIRPKLMCNEASETAIVGNLVAYKSVAQQVQ